MNLGVVLQPRDDARHPLPPRLDLRPDLVGFGRSQAKAHQGCDSHPLLGQQFDHVADDSPVLGLAGFTQSIERHEVGMPFAGVVPLGPMPPAD